MRELKK